MHQPHQRQLADGLGRHHARALKVYARANQATASSPRSSCRAPCRPVTVAGTLAQILAEALGRHAPRPAVPPGAPVVFGSFASSISMQSGAPTFGTPEPALVLLAAAQLARRLGVPFRSGGGAVRVQDPDAQAAYETAQTLLPTCRPASTSCCMPRAGSRAGSPRAMRNSSWTPTSAA
jgi:trimethylamine--corrinoid protein Co-methyltransferase